MVSDSIEDGKTIDQPVGGKAKEGELSPDAMFGQYRIIRLLGRGGMGEVYEVEHRVLQRRYALKIIPDELVGQKGFLERFEREARVMAHLEHTHIVKVDDFGETGGRYWLRMELVEGVAVGEGKVRTLAELAEYGEGKIEQGLLANVLSQVLDGLGYAHGKGAIHRDLKPANMLLTGKDQSSICVKISDFGLVRLVGEEWVRSRAEQSVSISLSLGDKATEADKDKSGTSTRSLLGTYEYMSPEQKRGEEVDARSDLYAVGLMAFRLLTGEKELSFELPSQMDSKLISEWDEVVRQALKPKKEQRFGSASEMEGAIIKVHKGLERRLEEENIQEQERKKQEAELNRQALEDKRRREEEERLRQEKEQKEEERKRQEAERKKKEEELRRLEEERRRNEEGRRKKEEDERKQWQEERAGKLEQERREQEVGRERRGRVLKKRIFAGVLVVLAIVGIAIGIGINKARQQMQIVSKPMIEQRVSPPPVSRQKVSTPAPKPVSEKSQPENTNSIGMKFVLIKAGTFQMGSPSDEEKRGSDETQHRVTLTKDFYLQTTEVTQAQYEEIMGNNPSDFQGSNLPVEQVTWHDAVEFCKKLSQKEGKEYRLPTEAEWEYACRAETRTPFYFGDTISTDQVNYDGNYTYGNGRKGVYRQKTTEVGSFPANSWGLYDMHGNVWEWCSDWYGDYPSGSVTDPTGPSSGNSKVVRGGSWSAHPEIVRSANRDRGDPDSRYDYFGFRCARTP